MPRKERTINMVEIARRKQAQRDRDERDLRTGQKTREQLRRETGLFASMPRLEVRIRDSKPL